MNGENSVGLEIALARRVNPNLVRKLRVSLTKPEWECLASVIKMAESNSESYAKLRSNSTETLKEALKEKCGVEFSDEAIEALKEFKQEIDKYLDKPFSAL